MTSTDMSPRVPHAARCATRLREQAPQQGWTVRELAEAIVAHCGHHRLRAHRLARGWSLTHLIGEMVSVAGVGQRLVASRVSRWERAEERPSNTYLDALCRVYNTGPVDLGFGADYSDNREAGHSSSQDTAVAAVSDGCGEPWLRHGLATERHGIVPGLGAAAQRADMVRRRMDEALSASLSGRLCNRPICPANS